LYDKRIVNLDFHTIPHFGDESVLQEHWAGARNKRMKGALTLIGQDADSNLMLPPKGSQPHPEKRLV